MSSHSILGNTYTKEEIDKLDSEYHDELKIMYKQIKCFDCNNRNASWATLKRNVFICTSCAQTLRADASNKIKSCMGTYSWHPDEMKGMRDGYYLNKSKRITST